MMDNHNFWGYDNGQEKQYIACIYICHLSGGKMYDQIDI